MKLHFSVFCAVVGFVGSASSVAFASPRPLPFSYPYATLGQGEAEVETYADFTPVRVVEAGNPQKHDWYGDTQFQIELEYGITDRLELGLYATWVPQSTADGEIPPMPENNGTKQRLRLRLAEPGEWPVDVSLYGEVVESDHEFELEGKVNLEKDFGKLAMMTNLWPSANGSTPAKQRGFSIQRSAPRIKSRRVFIRGIEGWMRWEIAQPQVFAARVSVQTARLCRTNPKLQLRQSLVVGRRLRAGVRSRIRHESRRSVRKDLDPHRRWCEFLRPLTSRRLVLCKG